MSYEPVADGDLVAVVTFLEMHDPTREPSPRSSLSLRQVDNFNPEAYRALFRRVGAPWLWFSRLIMDDERLTRIIRDPSVHLFVVEDQGRHVGMLELDFRDPGQCELAFVGLVPELCGKGHGRWLIATAVQRAWREDVRRVHVHTCTLDHPAALAAYRRAGFTAYRRAIERFPDPRRLGILPSDCAPQIPTIG